MEVYVFGDPISYARQLLKLKKTKLWPGWTSLRVRRTRKMKKDEGED